MDGIAKDIPHRIFSLARDSVVIIIAVVLFFQYPDDYWTWVKLLPILAGFFLVAAACQERRVRHVFILFLVALAAFYYQLLTPKYPGSHEVSVLWAPLILLLMICGLGLSYIVSQPTDMEKGPGIKWKVIGPVTFVLLMFLLMVSGPGGHTRSDNAVARSALKNLATAQEGFYADHETYTDNLELFHPPYKMAELLDLKILLAGPEHWVGIAKYKDSKTWIYSSKDIELISFPDNETK